MLADLFRMVAAGLLVGLVGAIGFLRFVRSLLFSPPIAGGLRLVVSR